MLTTTKTTREARAQTTREAWALIARNRVERAKTMQAYGLKVGAATFPPIPRSAVAK